MNETSTTKLKNKLNSPFLKNELSNWIDISRKKILIMVNRFSSSLIISELKLKPWQDSILLLFALMVFKFKDNCWCYWEKETFVMTYISKTSKNPISEWRQTDRQTHIYIEIRYQELPVHPQSLKQYNSQTVNLDIYHHLSD